MRSLLLAAAAIAAVLSTSIDSAEAGPFRRFRPSPGPLRAPAAARAGTEGASSFNGIEVDTDLPRDQRLKNTGGRDGAGLCVFTSIEHAGRYQNVPALIGFQQKMRAELGGGYPAKVDVMMRRYAPGVQYLQYEGRDPAILKAALKSGRMPSVTYDGRDPHYGGRIAHMVDIVAWNESADLVAVLDNNYVGETQLVWLKSADFISRWLGSRGVGWTVILLAPPPPPVPRNEEGYFHEVAPVVARAVREPVRVQHADRRRSAAALAQRA